MNPFEQSHPHEKSGENPEQSHGESPSGPGRPDPRDPAEQLRAMQARREAERAQAGARPDTAPISLATGPTTSSTATRPNRTRLWRGLVIGGVAAVALAVAVPAIAASNQSPTGVQSSLGAYGPMGGEGGESAEGATVPGATAKAPKAVPAVGGPAAGGPACDPGARAQGHPKGGPAGGPPKARLKGPADKNRPVPPAGSAEGGTGSPATRPAPPIGAPTSAPTGAPTPPTGTSSAPATEETPSGS